MLLLGELHPQLVLVFEVAARLVHPFLLPGISRPRKAVAIDLILVLRGCLLVVIKARCVLDLSLPGHDLNNLPILIHADQPPRHERTTLPQKAQQAHLHAQVLRRVGIIDKQVVYLADLLAVAVVDLMAVVAILYLHKPVAVFFYDSFLLS
jgi:hypothetical protein